MSIPPLVRWRSIKGLPQSHGRAGYELAFEGREGRVRLGDSDWPAQLPRGTAPPVPEARLRVVGVKGVVLMVQPADP